MKEIHEKHHEWSLAHEIHAEQNAIAFAARSTISTEGCTLYTTTAPCCECARLIIAAGIKRVVYKDLYSRTNKGLNLLNEAGVITDKVN